MLHKVYLTSHARMSGCRWVVTSLWLSESWRSLLYSSLVYSCHLFAVSSAYVQFIPFLSFIVTIFEWNVPLVSQIFFEEISSLSYSLLFLYFFFFFLHWSLSSDDEESACNTGDPFNPWVGKVTWRRKWQPSPVLLPWESLGQRSVVGSSP